MKAILGCVLLLFVIVLPIHAQEPRSATFRRFDIGWNVLSYSRQGRTNLYGGDLSFTVHVSEHLGIAADLAVHQTILNPSLTTATYRFGPRYYLRPARRFTPFGEILVGGTHGEISVTSIPISGVIVGGAPICVTCGPITTTAGLYSNGFALAAGGGADMRIKPWFSWRAVQADYSLLRPLGDTSTGVRIGTGIVFRFGS